MKVVVDFAVKRMNEFAPRTPDADRVARLWMGNQVPTRSAALAALRKVAKDEAYAADVADRMIELMLADGEVKDAKMDAAWAIVKGLERADKRKAK